jgi:hypothetical protein
VYHRFWAQSEIATANALYGLLFPKAAGTESGKKGDTAQTPHGADDKTPGKKARAGHGGT